MHSNHFHDKTLVGTTDTNTSRGLPSYSCNYSEDRKLNFKTTTVVRGAAAHVRLAVSARTQNTGTLQDPDLNGIDKSAEEKIMFPPDWNKTLSSAMVRKDQISKSLGSCQTVNGNKLVDQMSLKESVFPQDDNNDTHYLSACTPHIPVSPSHRGPVCHAHEEVMAAAALTFLSTSPVVLSAPQAAPGKTCTVTDPACRGRKASLSASYSSSTSGNWSWDASDQSGPSTPSPPLPSDISRNGASSSHETADELEPAHFLFDDPSPRKRKNSVKVMFKCLWKNCAKVLSTSAGMQKHVRTVHLGCNGDWEPSEGEEDFYYSEVEVNMDSLTEGLSSLTPASPTTAPHTPCFPQALGGTCTAPAPIIQRAGLLFSSPLSQSAPSTLCHIRTDHAYQAASPVGIPSASNAEPSRSGASLSWQPPPEPVMSSFGHVANGETRQPVQRVAVARMPPSSSPVSRPSSGSRKLRGEARKCRKVYGMDKRDMWCTACRWKKACQRFTD